MRLEGMGVGGGSTFGEGGELRFGAIDEWWGRVGAICGGRGHAGG